MYKKLLKNTKLTSLLLLAIYTVIICMYFLGKGYKYTEMFRFLLQTYAFYILMASIHKKLLNFWIIFTLIVTCIIYPTETVYGRIGFDFFCSIYYTSLSESISYMKIIPFHVIISLIVLLAISVFLIKTKKTTLKLGKITNIILLIFLLSFPIKKILKPSSHNSHAEDYFKDYFYVLPLRKVSLLYLYFEVKEQDENIDSDSKNPDTWQIIEKPEKINKKNIVIVLGESVRREFLHCYGFPIKNTPFIEKSNKIQFNNYISAASHTSPSLLRTLTLSKNLKTYEINNSIISLANKVGYKTYWISNQGKIGQFDEPVSKIAKRSDSCVFFKKGGYDITNLPDKKILPIFDDIIDKKNDEAKLIILHTMGSHPSSCDRTDNKHDEFIKSKDISCYNKSIKNLDKFLEHVHTRLKETGAKFDLIYLSDHGLTVSKNNTMIHADKKKGAYHTPLFVWNDTLKSTKKIIAYRTGKDFPHLFSQLLGVKTKNIKVNYKFLSESKNEDHKPEIFNNNSILNYEDLEDDSIDDLIKEINKK